MQCRPLEQCTVLGITGEAATSAVKHRHANLNRTYTRTFLQAESTSTQSWSSPFKMNPGPPHHTQSTTNRSWKLLEFGDLVHLCPQRRRLLFGDVDLDDLLRGILSPWLVLNLFAKHSFTLDLSVVRVLDRIRTRLAAQPKIDLRARHLISPWSGRA